jgi:hypothetical protein
MSEISVSSDSIRRRIVDRIAQASRIASGPSKNAIGLLSLDTEDEQAFRKALVAPWRAGRRPDGPEPAAPGGTACHGVAGRARLRAGHQLPRGPRYRHFAGRSDRDRRMQSAFSASLPASTSARCGVGSVSSNIGHLESAAGLAGVLKAVAVMAHRRLPASIHVTTVNSRMTLLDDPAVSEEIRHYPDHERSTNSTGMW